MAQQINRLSDGDVRKAQPNAGGKPNLLNDGNNLYLRVTQGAEGVVHKVWLFRANGSWSGGIGPYPDVSLKAAREKAAELRGQVRAGVDPVAERRRQKVVGDGHDKTFAEVATEYYDAHKAKWTSDRYALQWQQEVDRYAVKVIGKLLVKDVDVAAVLKVLGSDWNRAPVIMKRQRARIEMILGYAMARGYRPIEPNPAAWHTIKHLLPNLGRKVESRAALPYEEIAGFVRELRQHPYRAAKPLEFLILTAARTDEVRLAKWSEIDWEARTWTVPANRTKMRKAHKVPLSEAAIAMLKGVTGDRTVDPTAYIFAGQSGDHAPLGNDQMRLLVQLIRPTFVNPDTGETQKPTTHGFRSTFRDWAGEEVEDISEEVAELALSHAVGDQTRRAYRRRTALEKRRVLMEQWAQYVDSAAPPADVPADNVVPLRAAFASVLVPEEITRRLELEGR